MKKIFIGISAFVGFSLLFSSCGNDFLKTEPTYQVSQGQLKRLAKIDPSVLNNSLSGVYALTIQKGVGGTESQTDFGQKGFDIISDMLCGDMVKPISGYRWYNDWLTYSLSTDKTQTGVYMFWRYYYKIVFGVNPIIESLGGDNAKFGSTDVDNQKKAILGQALALRAYAYFYLLQFYSRKYDSADKVLPLYTKTSQRDQPLSTQKQVYDQVVSDLTKAVAYLDGFKRTSKTAINQNVAKGLLAYTYAAMGQYDKVKELTTEVINSNEFTMMTPEEIVYNPSTRTGSGFNNVKIPGWMWGVDITTGNKLDLVSFWGQMDIYTYSYPSVGAVRTMSDLLYKSMHPDDIRRGQFGKYDSDTDSTYSEDDPKGKGFDYVPFNKFFTPDRIIQGQRSITTDYVYMRVAEMFLLKIEAEAFLGDDTSAKNDLKTFLSGRIKDLSYIDGLSGDALKAEIHLQWRLEFWGEGKAYLAMKRFKEPITLGTNRFDAAEIGKVINYDDQRLSLVIPRQELINNHNIKE